MVGCLKNSKPVMEAVKGCPLSALLFVFSVEIMALNLRGYKDIKGITVKLDGKKRTVLKFHN